MNITILTIQEDRIAIWNVVIIRQHFYYMQDYVFEGVDYTGGVIPKHAETAGHRFDDLLGPPEEVFVFFLARQLGLPAVVDTLGSWLRDQHPLCSPGCSGKKNVY
jgi:hypothetical protein